MGPPVVTRGSNGPEHSGSGTLVPIRACQDGSRHRCCVVRMRSPLEQLFVFYFSYLEHTQQGGGESRQRPLHVLEVGLGAEKMMTPLSSNSYRQLSSKFTDGSLLAAMTLTLL